MTDEQHIARLTFWMGADAAREYAAAMTAKRLAEEQAADCPVFDAGQDYE